MSVFDITNRCNLKCIYCCRGESLNKQVDEVSTEDVLNTIKQRSIHNFNTNLDANDKILTLSTCYSDTERTVVHAKLIKRSPK